MTHASARTAPGGRIFQRFKYGIYFLLALDILLFLWQEWLAAAHTFADGVSAGDLVNAFTATIDTAAWVVLLLVFELETSQIPPERLTGRLRWALHGVRAFCYVFIVFAFYGYILQCNSLYDVSTIAVAEVCSLADTGASYLVTLDEFAAITTANCEAMPAQSGLFRLVGLGDNIVSDPGTLLAVQRLAWTDVINAGDWLLVVLLLELDVWLKQSGYLRGATRRLLEICTAMLYLVLLACAVYWGFAGDFLDFWDAFLWLVAFVFIEMNVFNPQRMAG
ncbi:MAG: hypothetical protein HYY36_07245 [Gammaproteobacteria bacterium]|nr:hypothetical protein [Gammaproteobacteria bacterium]